MNKKSEQIELSILEFEKNYSNNEDKIIEITNKYIEFDEFKNILLSSFIISIYSYFESKLNDICRHREKIFNVNN